MKYVCDLCGMIYDEVAGDESRGIPAGTSFDDLPADFECPDCGSGKDGFIKASSGESAVHTPTDDRYHSQR